MLLGCGFKNVPNPNSNETRRWRSMAVTPELLRPFVTHDLIECAACHESERASSGERKIKRWRATEQAEECDGLLAAEQAALS
ncbi:hypothetical protein F2Q69_00048708 [Brassica cretica]|uniref:Uncharacterized protein n=1 Tax=Brassica cretica TaxID=69181 RepID=A0A8S9PUH9_BRACR|nr:hypothetical protein F2Q69_00048708 [Brassica cretica]